MDLYKAIRALYEEKKRLDKLIESLEELHARGGRAERPVTRSRRGRKKMSAAERQQVSERMKRYWAKRRSERQAALAAEPAGEPEAEPVLGATPEPQNLETTHA